MNTVEFHNVCRDFKIYEHRATSVKGKVFDLLRGRKERYRLLQALKELSFTVEKGKTLGILGENGAGKTTILKLIARILRPTSGSIKVEGRVSTVLELGTGFNIDLTGAENIFVNGAILGLSRKKIIEKYEDIVSFAELEEFIDTPMKHYSTGMHLRLGMAIAIHVFPDIVLIDDVLSVGDLNFQQKTLEKVTELKDEGKTIVYVSHDLPSVKNLCDWTFWLDKGRIVTSGPPADIIDAYVDTMHRRRLGLEEIALERLSLLSGRGEVARVEEGMLDPLQPVETEPEPNSLVKYRPTFVNLGRSEQTLNDPRSIATDQDGNVYVADYGSHRVVKFSPLGKFLGYFGSKGYSEGRFLSPFGLAVTKPGDILVTEIENCRIQRFSPDGQLLQVISGDGKEGPLDAPHGLALDSRDNLYVVDKGNNRVVKFSPEGEQLMSFGRPGTEAGEFFDPVAIALDSSDNAYVSGFHNHRIQKFTAEGKFLMSFGDFGTEPGQFNGPHDMVVLDDEGFLFVTDHLNDRIQKFRLRGDEQPQFECAYTGQQGSFSHPCGLIVDRSGILYVTVSNSNQIQRIKL